jgi:hypothetical protein
MARARNIKPSFFKNETLVELPFEHRLLFVGLWTLADKDGRLEDRPKRIKMELFPADNVDVEQGLALLEQHGFINRYSAGGFDVVQVIAFTKHQSPHHTEKASELPDANGEITVKPRKQDGGNPPDSLIPDSLIPDSPNPEPADAEAPRVDYPALFATLWDNWPSGYGDKGSRKNAEAAFLKLKPDKELFAAMLRARDAQARDKAARALQGAFVAPFQHVERWIKNQRWTDEIEPISAVSHRSAAQAGQSGDMAERAARLAFGDNPGAQDVLDGDFCRVDPHEIADSAHRRRAQ